MALWSGFGNNRRGNGNDWEMAPFGLNDVLGDFDREFRRMNRELNRLERAFTQGQGTPNAITTLFDRHAVMPTITQDNSGQKMCQFQFDTNGFNPEDITIKTENGNRLVVTGKHEEKGADHHQYREFRRLVSIPEGATLERMESRLAPNGILTIQAPYQPPAITNGNASEKILPIQHEKGGK